MSTSTPRRALTRPRPALTGGINTASTPNLAAAYNSLPNSVLNGLRATSILGRKSSLNALTQGSLASIPDASEGYGLSTVLDVDHTMMERMTPPTPAGEELGDIEVGDLVDVPGNMRGTVKFVGSVQGKKGMFAGVELSEEFASRGKNSGDVDGVSYFTTSIECAGIFLPLNRATKRGSPPTSSSSILLTPTTPSASSVRAVGQSSNAFTPPTPSLSKFNQSTGPGRAPSPQFKKSRPSLPRPESPLRKPQLTTLVTRPPAGTPAQKGGVRYAASPSLGKFSQSVRGTRDAGDPSKKAGYGTRSGTKTPGGPRSTSALGQAPLNYSDDENTPVGKARQSEKGSVGSISSINSRVQSADTRAHGEEIARLRSQVEERDRQLKEQAASLAEMENSLAEVQSLMGGSDAGSRNRGNMEDKDAAQLRSLLREKNERIAMLTAEFDAHRADFRSTIDTLELASTETERVYEKRVEDLLQELRELQENAQGVQSVARQLKQLEELVQELEEGLEDARRGEAEARGEVEFLRGEVERGRSELRREREKAAAVINGSGQGVNGDAIAKEVEQRDDEIRGLKAIIHSLSRDAVPDTQDPQKTPTARNANFPRGRRASQGLESADDRQIREKLEREVAELKVAMESKNNREEELERELERLRRGSAGPGHRISAITVGSNGTATQDQSSARDSRGTVVSWRDRDLPKSPETHRRANTLETMPECDAYSSATDGSILWCEICETGGHDILGCTNMFSTKQGQTNGTTDFAPKAAPPQQLRIGRDIVREGLKGLSPNLQGGEFKPAPLSPVKKSSAPVPPVAIIPNPMDQGPVAGKSSRAVDLGKWCALCERDGHSSVDCPFEDAF